MWSLFGSPGQSSLVGAEAGTQGWASDDQGSLVRFGWATWESWGPFLSLSCLNVKGMVKPGIVSELINLLPHLNYLWFGEPV